MSNYNSVSKSDNKTRTCGIKGQSFAVETCTEFALHISQQTRLSEKRKGLIDYSQRRLERYIKIIEDPQQKMVLVALLHDYIKGDVAIAWKRGLPVYINITKA